LLGINFEYLSRLGRIPDYLNVDLSKNLLIFLVVGLPFVYKKMFKILKTSQFILFFIYWALSGLLISYTASRALGYSVPFSNDIRTIEQLGGYVMGIVFGFYIYRLVDAKPEMIVRTIHVSVVLVFLGIAYQVMCNGVGSILIDRLYGISGEPKGLALYLVPYFFALYASPLKSKNKQWAVLLVSLAATLLTLSATALIALIFVFLLFAMFGGVLKLKSVVVLAFLLALIGVISAFPVLSSMLLDRIGYYAGGKYIEGVQALIDLPLIGSVVVEANDFPVAMFFKDNPLLMITGIGLGQESILTHGYIGQFGGVGFLNRDYQGYITPNMALLANTANYGLLMVFALAAWGVRVAPRITIFLGAREKFIFYFFFSHFMISLLVMRTAVPITTSIFVVLSFLRSTNLLREHSTS